MFDDGSSRRSSCQAIVGPMIRTKGRIDKRIRIELVDPVPDA